jgi:hypothetical protein
MTTVDVVPRVFASSSISFSLLAADANQVRERIRRAHLDLAVPCNETGTCRPPSFTRASWHDRAARRDDPPRAQTKNAVIQKEEPMAPPVSGGICGQLQSAHVLPGRGISAARWQVLWSFRHALLHPFAMRSARRNSTGLSSPHNGSAQKRLGQASHPQGGITMGVGEFGVVRSGPPGPQRSRPCRRPAP